MKKILIVLIFTSLLVITACGGPFTSTSSYLYVVKKGHSKDYKEVWIIAFNPNNKKEQEKIKIMVKEPMVWNLIEVNKTYFTSYSKEGDNPWKLDQINYPGDNDTMR
ncbi:hypothetical protein J5Y03_17570 [Bacillus sp. RG28]|uniref:Lipoprotein n=1 Tax=Gottfriedia endophytica TaxID=2820819 RepID=A0A940NM30_9BACI|nr:hypothetical protein [Gottfriedia endophytica]MBP0726970.1 hypothetical protein [Gottfriedia endophytica]